MNTSNPLHKPDVLKPVLNTLQLWGMAVGLVISGIYFGWSFGWATAGTLGFTITALFIAAMYTTFIFSFTELTAAIPQAGGPFAYSKRAFGPMGGYVAGAATLIEFVFAPPAIALAIGAYLNVQFSGLDPKMAALSAYIVFHDPQYLRRTDCCHVRVSHHVGGYFRIAGFHGGGCAWILDG